VLPTLKPTETAVPPPDLVAMTTDRLKGELANMLTSTAARLVRLAWVVRILEERGEDLSDLGLNLIPYLRRIAYGQMSAEAVVRFSGSPALMEAISMLPRPDQERIASGANVELVVRRGDKEFDTRQCDPARLTRSQFRQIFAKGRVRDRAEQILYLEETTGKPAPERRTKGRLRPDAARGGFWVNRTFVPAADAVAALGALAGLDEGDEVVRETPLVVKVSEAEHTSVGIASSRGRVSMSVLVRRALAAYGLFGHS
jgi:hypothetical protein